MQAEMSETADSIRRQLWDEALRSFGTAYIFEQRAKIYKRRLNIQSFLGIVVPVTIGSIYLSFSTQQKLLAVLVTVAGILGVIQLIVTVWSLVSGWQGTYSYALESLAANYRLADKFTSLAQSPPEDVSDLKMQFDLLEIENRFRSDQDNKQGVTDEEKRKGMRAALRRYQRACSACEEVPISMKPSNCDVCGNFKLGGL